MGWSYSCTLAAGLLKECKQVQLVLFGLRVSLSPTPPPSSFSYPQSMSLRIELGFSQKYLKTLSHVAWIYKEEIIQTTDASEGRGVHRGFGKEYLAEFNTVLPINITVATNQK